MSTQTQPQTPARGLDPNVLQRRAAMPEDSIWVNASAGTGKTKVLTDRILRLLLPRENGQDGTDPQKILGLTFTKAGASEMAIRISNILSHWAIMPLEGDKGLGKELKKLLGREPNDNEIQTARRLFADVIDTPGQIKIMTIHAFCQSVLTRFPLEANLTPGFRLAEDRESFELLNDAKTRCLNEAKTNDASPLHEALTLVSSYVNEDQFLELLSATARERGQLQTILNKNFGIDGLYTNLCTTMNILAGTSPQSIIQNACQETSFNGDALRSAARTMIDIGTKTDQEKGHTIATWLGANEQERATNYATYKSAFLTNEGAIRAKLANKAVAEKHPDIPDILSAEAQRIFEIEDCCKAAITCAATRDLFTLCDAILKQYESLKTAKNILDYEDLIFKTLELLQKRSDWVQYKLDQGIDHILIDEAQDTNPEQWQIIEALCTEFFVGQAANDETRTVFTVGDEKQSIYSFQRASPEEFARMQSHFAKKIQDAEKSWNRVDLNISFRSLQCVLDCVDQTFASPETRKGLGIESIKHHAFRSGQASTVELWPLCENDEEEKIRTWDPPVTITDQKSGASKLADQIANTIRRWIDNKEQLPSHNREIQPGDIMILVRTRNAFVHQLIRALKLKNIPVGGLDRMILNDQLVVQDLIAAANFALLPSDDLTLACLLKSPLIGMDETTLLELAYDRKKSLFESLKASAYEDITTYLQKLQQQATHQGPYAFFAHILQTPCPADKQSGLKAIKQRLGIDAMDALNEFINTALAYERDHTTSLQSFIHWQSGGQSEIKRESGETSDHVRIMTVHGSKGLQAPIVFLPDTTGTPASGGGARADNRLLWPSQSNLELPLWAPRANLETTLYENGKTTLKSRLDEEYRRLLYVAMTRAEDRLYIAGHKTKKPVPENCWYKLMEQGIKNITDHEQTEDGILRYNTVQTKNHDRESKSTALQSQKEKLPEWIFQSAPNEPHPPKPLTPSRPSGSESAALSPLKAEDNARFRRGNHTHTLLQFLPGIPEDNRETTAQSYLEKHATDLSETVRAEILLETLKILNDPEFAPIFASGSRAEVPITGLLADGRLISGQIDRLLVTDDEIFIIDYKTNRPPPKEEKDIPAIYRDQMRAYADTLKSIYPDRKIRCALLWTDSSTLMPLDP